MHQRRLALLMAGGLAVIVVVAGPAWAHVEVEADPGAPGATDATLKITAEGESTSAGINRLEVVANPPIPADQVTLTQGPTGWTVSGGPLGGFVVAGPALAPGTDATVALRVRQLPDAPQVTFKVLETYGDGTVARWIELPGPDGKEPEHPAPIIKLTAGAASAVSPKPAGNNADDDSAGDGALARTGAADKALAAAGGTLLLAGGLGLVAGTGRTRRRR